MIFALLPVKSPNNAKQRLEGVLTPRERETLAWAMYEEMLKKLSTVRGLDRVVVVTADKRVAAMARDRGADVFMEDQEHSHSRSADDAARRAMAMGATAVVMLPIDVPLATRDEIESLVLAAAAGGVTVVPSRNGTGTNALVRNPPDAIDACFGPDSFRKHCGQAEARDVALKVMRPAGILFDLDTAKDIAELISRAPDNRIAQLLYSFESKNKEVRA